PAVQIDDALNDRETKAGGRLAGGRLRRKPLEAAEQAGNVLRREARALICDLDGDAARLLCHEYVDLAPQRAVLHRIAHKVINGFTDTVGIADGGLIRRRRHRDGLVLFRRKRPIRLDDLAYQYGNIDRLAADGDVERIGPALRGQGGRHPAWPV